MSWKSIQDQLPKPIPTDEGPRPIRVLVYAQSINQYALADYDDTPYGRRNPWQFREPSYPPADTDHWMAAKVFRHGELITHWQPLTRPRRKAGGP